MRAVVLMLGLLLAGLAGGQEIVLDGPASDVQPREYCQILVHGLSDADLPAASIEWTPRDGTTLMPARLWGGQPFLLFASRQPGTYTIVVTQNAWRANLDAAVDAARRAPVLDGELFRRLESVQTEMRNRYPVRTGSCTVTVAGDVPRPPDPPAPPPPPVNTQADQVTIVTESTETLSAEQLEIVNGEAVRSAAAAAGLEFQAVDKDIAGPDVQRLGHVLAAVQGQPVPRLVFSAAGKVIDNQTLPATVAETVRQIKGMSVVRGPLSVEKRQRTTDNGPLTTDHGPLTTDHGPRTTPMISYFLSDRALMGAAPRVEPYGLAGGAPMAFIAPQEAWLSRAGIGGRTIKPHCGTIKRQRFSDCTANMATNLVEIVRSQQGLPHVELSPTALYAHINNGRDAGSNLHDAAEYVREVGCVPASMWPVTVWRRSEPAGYKEMAAKFRGLEWIDIPSAAGVLTGIGWYGKPVGIGVRWGAGGHAIAVVDYASRASVPRDHLRAYAELVKHFEREDRALAEACGKAMDGDGLWFEIENSWGTDYGENGFGWLPWSQVDSGVRTRYGGICVTSVTYTIGV